MNNTSFSAKEGKEAVEAVVTAMLADALARQITAKVIASMELAG